MLENKQYNKMDKLFMFRGSTKSTFNFRVPGCQKLQMTTEPGLAQLYSYGNSGRQRVNCIVIHASIQSSNSLRMMMIKTKVEEKYRQANE